jgi:hypothetical protein
MLRTTAIGARRARGEMNVGERSMGGERAGLDWVAETGVREMVVEGG